MGQGESEKVKSKEIFRPGGFDRPLLLATLLLLLVGFIMIFSASALPATEKYRQPFHFLLQQITGAGLGLGLMALIVTSRRVLYQEPAFILGLVAITLLLLALCYIMPPIAGTNRWITLFGLRFQPSELAKISLTLLIAFYLEKKKENLSDLMTWLPILGVTALFVLLILREPDLGTSVLVLFISFGLFFIAGIKVRYLGLIMAVAGLFFFLYFQQLPRDDYRRQRWEAFRSPEEHRDRAGFQILQSRLAVGSGGLLGVGLGESTQKLYFLPCAQTDFIYAIIGEEFGLLGSLAILALYLIIFWRGWQIAGQAPSLSHKLAAYGLTLAICTQALLNISIVLALGPTKGVPLPFISYGRSALVCQLIAVGFLLNISQRKPLNGGGR